MTTVPILSTLSGQQCAVRSVHVNVIGFIVFVRSGAYRVAQQGVVCRLAEDDLGQACNKSCCRLKVQHLLDLHHTPGQCMLDN